MHGDISLHTTRPVQCCPWCAGSEIRPKGKRRNKFGDVQLYLCRHCDRKFTPLLTRNKTYPLRVIIDALTFYNRLYTLEGAARAVGRRYGLAISRQTLRNWLDDFADYVPFTKLRAAAARSFDRRDAIAEAQLLHGQVYAFKYHRAKTALILDRLRETHPVRPLQAFLEGVPRSCPHTLFRDNRARASSTKGRFRLDGLVIKPRPDPAVQAARFALQAVADNRQRHETLQGFMLANDGDTVAVEVPVYLTAADLDDMRPAFSQLPFTLGRGETITGHIDIVQLRFGLIHILDYKPGAKRIKPIEQLTLYALALSRLTGIGIYHFKCAWFDDEDYFDFYPRHLIHPHRTAGMPETIPAVPPPPNTGRKTMSPAGRQATAAACAGICLVPAPSPSIPGRRNTGN
ncbi:PD-(D/E)XK nuclease family protein [Hyphomicrobium sp.]|uniref:PD-(D/E)XK nuclease family protein n=1 Tax=Hyphomicrobium sp. TaxID=82 RepID=UPI002FDF9DED